MTNDQKDAICQLWVEIFGTQEGVGYNCPQGAYDFAEVVMAYVCKELEKEILSVKNNVASTQDYAQGRWDMVGEAQDIILARIKK